MLSAFTFASSNAALPASMECCDKKLGISKKNLCLFTSARRNDKYGRKLYYTGNKRTVYGKIRDPQCRFSQIKHILYKEFRA
ncbi:MAG: hypothetical protein IJR45_00630 [Firmicutes bacterium]|nr:hypothetical protein [Bacillota bacterium]MBQ9603897.1 hypothetical protein [Bacillota bacterium]